MFHKSNSEVVRCGSCYTDIEQREKNRPYAIYVQFRDNSIKLLQPKPKHDAKVLTTIFPPPNAEEIKDIRFCTIIKRIVIMQQSGTLCFYKLERQTSILEKIIQPSDLKDAQGQALA